MPSIYRYRGSWRAQVRLKGKPPISRVFPSKVEAVAWTREMEAAPPPPAAVTYREIHEVYTQNSRLGGQTKQHIIASLVTYWGDHRLSEITPSQISNYIITRSRTVGPATIMSELVYLGVVVQHGGVLLGNDEAQKVKAALAAAIKTHRALGTVSDSVQRTRRPTEEELLRLRDYLATKQHVAPVWDVVCLALTTAMRLGEICGAGGITWGDLDKEKRLLRVRSRKDPTTPGGRDDVIPLLRGPVTLRGNVIDPLEVLMRQKCLDPQGRIFPFVENTPSQAFKRACQSLEIRNLRFHDLRHEAISRLFEYGYSIPEVAKVSGHKSWQNLQRYTQIDPAHLHSKTGS